MKDFNALEELLLSPKKIVAKCSDLEDIGGLEELNRLPTKNVGRLEELNSLPIENIGGLEELNDFLYENIKAIDGAEFDTDEHNQSNLKLYSENDKRNIFQSPMLVSAKPTLQTPINKDGSKPNISKGKKHSNKDDKPLPMAELSKVISERIHIVSYKKLLYYYDDGVYKPCLQADFLELLWEILSEDELGKYNLLNFKNAYIFITSKPDIKIDCFPTYDNCAVCNDYIVNLVSGKFRKISYHDLVTSKINANYIPTDNIYTPVFDEFLSSVSNGDEQLERLICEVIGWCCTLPNHSRKVFFVLGYAPNSGKSVIGNFLRMLYSDESASYVPIDEMGTRFGLSPIVGKAINISMDLPGSVLNSAAVSAVKMLTGGDGVSIDIKYMQPMQYKQPIHLIFASNHPIKLNKPDDAFFERMVYVPFNKSIPPEDQDPELLDKLWRERDGIVTKCLFAVQDMINDGRPFSCEPYDPDEYYNDLSDSNNIEDYVSENVILSRDKSDELSTTEMYNNYIKWCKLNGLTPESQCKFSKYISEMYGIDKRKRHTTGQNVRVFIGVRYKTPYV